jgi:hypothetical protein
MKSNYGEEFTDPMKRKNIRVIRKLVGTRMFEDIHDQGMDFPTYFKKYYKLPYNNFASLIYGHYDFLIRFENLQEDFARVLQILGIEPKRPLPVRNPTQGRKKDFWSYYSPEIIPRAKKLVGPFMKQWGYEFPPEWGEYNLTWWDKSEFELFSLMRNVKWKYLRFL